MKSRAKIYSLSLVLILTGLTGCEKDWLTENPLNEFSEALFWRNESDATLALNAMYEASFWTVHDNDMRAYSNMTDEGRDKSGGTNDYHNGNVFYPTDDQVVTESWENAFILLFRSNLFLENIDRPEMDEALRAQFRAEARFFRAEQYFWLSFRFGDVPLFKKVPTLLEANNATRTPKEEIVDFVLTELTEVAADLPLSRPANEKGRILKGAALAFKGRLLMLEERWADAAATYKEIIDSDAHIIDDRFQDLWTVRGNESKEIIYSHCAVEGNEMDNQHYQRDMIPESIGGYSQGNTYQETVDAFLMTDGLSIDESPLYDPDNPFDNRDPRLYASVFLPGYTVFKGELYVAHPDSTKKGVGSQPGVTGYHVRKFVDEQHDLPVKTGADYLFIRYSEVLLSYLECMIESGATIDQALLDQTINKIRLRAAVNMPIVTETDPALLTEILRNERRTELFVEPFIRHMDLLRWGLWPECMNTEFHGMKLTDDPANYTAFPVDENGHLISWDRTGQFLPHNVILPIPQAELDINPDLGQNPGY